jgi:Caspase domain/Domain of unknown function (DUF4384)
MKRRLFLQQVGLVLAAAGGSDLGLTIGRYHQALAAPTQRKLALLIGINQYRDQALNGCLTDVAMQRELLIHRFGFAPSNVLTLVNEQATQTRIATAFATHLRQAKSDDVVVVHFSGYSRLIQGDEAAWVSLLTADQAVGEEAIGGLSLDTLGLLGRSLATQQVTIVLDTGPTYVGTPLQGNLRVRSRPSMMAELDAAEVALQAQLLAQLGLSQAKRSPSLVDYPGAWLTAAGPDQMVLEAQWHGFSAGLFTYALTQCLWQAMPAISLQVCMGQTAATIADLAAPDQVPSFGSRGDQATRPYYAALGSTRAVGVITAIEDNKTATVWLGGLAANVLELAGSNSSFSLAADPTIVLPLVARDGLTAKVRLPLEAPENAGVEAVKVGQFVQEAVRMIPRRVELAVALDPALERIERIDATSAFDGIAGVTLVAAGEAADYLFGKLPQAATQVAALPTANLVGLVPPSSYGLFSQGKSPIANTTGAPGEAIKLAVRRLGPQLQTLLAIKLLNLLVNDQASRLAIQATMAVTGATPSPQVLWQQATLSIGGNQPVFSAAKVSVGSQVHYQIQNLSGQSIYFVVLGVDSNGKMFYYTQPATAPELTQANLIAPNQTVTLPPLGSTAEWIVRSPIGSAETYVICSRSPFNQTQPLLSTTEPTPTFRPLANPLAVAQTILQDLHQGEATDAFTLVMDHWATLRLAYQVV